MGGSDFDLVFCVDKVRTSGLEAEINNCAAALSAFCVDGVVVSTWISCVGTFGDDFCSIDNSDFSCFLGVRF